MIECKDYYICGIHFLIFFSEEVILSKNITRCLNYGSINEYLKKNKGYLLMFSFILIIW